MTEFQNSKYWRRWSAVSRANGWRMVKRTSSVTGLDAHRIAAAAVTNASPAHVAVWAAACQLAAQRACGVTADLLRHACHIVALGRDKSHAAMTNKEFDALLVYWGDERVQRGLLLEPLDLASLIARDHPEQKERQRQVLFLKTECLGGYVVHESARMFGTKDWETLPDADLGKLFRHLHDRPRGQKQKPESRKQKSDERRSAPESVFQLSAFPISAFPNEDPDWSVE